ncbi:hypothetical protein BJ875DRAFT_496253 [Amylocarpus encephaloides]|uniref:Uncharacterized protein n=1 Tax=Amylocarpus encephaloides TaxID=45428 RepID=A0A9P7YHK4_9HELO|nr:hypothetical protein BJ875DRAFT_496253 [Amylocarpus encephaloides]
MSANAKVPINDVRQEKKSQRDYEDDMIGFLYQAALKIPVDMKRFLKQGTTFNVAMKTSKATKIVFKFEDLPKDWAQCADLYLLKSLEHLKMSFKIRNDILFQIYQVDSSVLDSLLELDPEFVPQKRDSQVKAFRKFEDYASSVIAIPCGDRDERLVRSLFKALDSRRSTYYDQIAELTLFVEDFTEDRLSTVKKMMFALTKVPAEDLNIKNAGKHERQTPIDDAKPKKSVSEGGIIAGNELEWVNYSYMPSSLFRYFVSSFGNSINVRRAELHRRSLAIGALSNQMRSIEGEISEEDLLEEEKILNDAILDVSSALARSLREMLKWEDGRTTWMREHCKWWNLASNEIYDTKGDNKEDKTAINLHTALEKGRVDSIINGGSPWTNDRTLLFEMWIERIKDDPSCDRAAFQSEKKVREVIRRLREVANARAGILQVESLPYTMTSEWESITTIEDLNQKVQETWAFYQSLQNLKLSTGRLFTRTAYDNYKVNWFQLEERRSVESQMCEHIKKAMKIIDQQQQLSDMFSSKANIASSREEMANLTNVKGKGPAVDEAPVPGGSSAAADSAIAIAKAKKKKRQRENWKKDGKGKEAEADEDGEEEAVEEVEEVGGGGGGGGGKRY